MDRATATVQVDSFPGPRAEQRVEYHHRFAAPSTYVYEFVWDTLADAEGPFVTDVDGNVLLDFTSHVGAAPLGYNNPKILDRMAEFDVVDPLKIAGQDFYLSAGDPDEPAYPGPAELMDLLTETTAGYGLDTVFLSNSGAEAVENAIKICYDASGGKYGVTFEGAFHGRTLGALSLNRSKEVYRRQFPEIHGIHEVPYCDDRSCTAATCSCGFFSDAETPSQLRRMLDPESGYVDAEDLAYVVLEPVQGEGGYRFPSDAFVEELAALREEHGFLVVADEIQSGMGRTGAFWAVDDYPLEPDVVCAAKGLRVGATVASSDTFPEETSRLSSTWGAGDVADAMQGALTIEAIHDHDLLANATAMGDLFLDLLDGRDLPNVVDTRGKGLMLAVEFDSKQRRDDVVDAAVQRGLLTLGCGTRTLRVLPPLDVTEREISMGADLLAAAVEDAA
jgi:4-aminobutyrate aminotransferase